MKVAIVGVTGLVGQKMLKILVERNFPVEELIPVASDKSIGKKIIFRGKESSVIDIQEAIEAKPDIALFSAGKNISLENAPKFALKGSIVIDNSSAWRMDKDKKLIVPEVNGHVLRIDDRIIANPNCSTIQMVMAMKPLHEQYQIKRVVVSTYQSVTGTGKKAVDQLYDERTGKKPVMVYPYKIDMNAIPHVDMFFENGYTKEEMKMVYETKKIFGSNNIAVNATCVRIPTIGGHAEALNIELQQDFEIPEVKRLLEQTPGISVMDDPSQNIYPMPTNAHEKDEVLVGRIRRDETQPKTLNMWVVSDNLRKGAATNAIQIAEYLLKHHLIY